MVFSDDDENAAAVGEDEMNETNESESIEAISKVRPNICCFFENLAIYSLTFIVLHSTDKYSKEQQISVKV